MWVGGIRMSTSATSGRETATRRRRSSPRRRGADDLHACVGEEAGQALPQQELVVRDHDPHGRSTSITIASSTVVVVSVPSSAPTRSSRSVRSSDPAGVDAIEGEAHPEPVVDARAAGAGLAGTGAGGRLREDEVRRRLDGDGQPAGGHRLDDEGDVPSLGERGRRGPQPHVGQDGRVDAMRDLAEVGDRGPDLGLGVLERGGSVRLDGRPGHPAPDPGAMPTSSCGPRGQGRRAAVGHHRGDHARGGLARGPPPPRHGPATRGCPRGGRVTRRAAARCPGRGPRPSRSRPSGRRRARGPPCARSRQRRRRRGRAA